MREKKLALRNSFSILQVHFVCVARGSSNSTPAKALNGFPDKVPRHNLQGLGDTQNENF
jgi:hypothetical protein